MSKGMISELILFSIILIAIALMINYYLNKQKEIREITSDSLKIKWAQKSKENLNYCYKIIKKINSNKESINYFYNKASIYNIQIINESNFNYIIIKDNVVIQK